MPGYRAEPLAPLARCGGKVIVGSTRGAASSRGSGICVPRPKASDTEDARHPLAPLLCWGRCSFAGDFFWAAHGREQFPKIAEQVEGELNKYKQVGRCYFVGADVVYGGWVVWSAGLVVGGYPFSIGPQGLEVSLAGLMMLGSSAAAGLAVSRGVGGSGCQLRSFERGFPSASPYLQRT
jgi:hypothetical protein